MLNGSKISRLRAPLTVDKARGRRPLALVARISIERGATAAAAATTTWGR